MIKIFLDSSVIIAGINSNTGASFAVLELVRRKKIDGFVSSIVVKEVLRNLKKKFSPNKTTSFLQFLAESSLKKVVFKGEYEVLAFRKITIDKDIHAIAGAAKSNAQYLVTLDKKHLLSLRDLSLSFKIISPGDLLKLL